MATKIKHVTREELYKILDERPEKEFMVLTYDEDDGKSDSGKMLKKRKVKNLTNKATIIFISESKPISKVDLKGNFGIIPYLDKRKLVKTILLPQLE